MKSISSPFSDISNMNGWFFYYFKNEPWKMYFKFLLCEKQALNRLAAK